MAPTSRAKAKQASSTFAKNANYDKLSEEGRLILDIIIEEYRGTMNEILSRIDEREEKITELQSEVSALRKGMSSLRERLDDVEADQRRDTIVLSGDGLPPATVGEDSTGVACDTIRSKVNFNLKRDHVISAHRIGKKSPVQGPDRRKLLVKLSHHEDMQELMSACRTVKPAGFYVSDNLTQSRSEILYALRRAKFRFRSKVSACGSLNGRVYVWIKHENPSMRNSKVFINSKQMLEDWCVRTLGVTATDLLGDKLHNDCTHYILSARF